MKPAAHKSPVPAVLFEDQHVIVIDKPAGLLSQGDDSGAYNLVDWLRTHVGRHYIGLVHRLDRNVSGLMVAAKRTKAARRLTESLAAGQLNRTYCAWLCGRLKEDQTWSHWLSKNHKTNTVSIHDFKVPGSKQVALFVRVIGHGAWKEHPLTLAEFALETGRSHQIRAQAQHAGFPIAGDFKYEGNDKYRGLQSVLKRPALHSYQLSFPHPASGEAMHFKSELPSDFSVIVRHSRVIASEAKQSRV